jgi:hypothetical protein
MVWSWFGHGRFRWRGLPFRVMEVQLLGPLVVQVDGSVVAVRGAKERAVLSLLALRTGSAVSTDQLVATLWGSWPPPSALRGLHNYVANLRGCCRPYSRVAVPAWAGLAHLGETRRSLASDHLRSGLPGGTFSVQGNATGPYPGRFTETPPPPSTTRGASSIGRPGPAWQATWSWSKAPSTP